LKVSKAFTEPLLGGYDYEVVTNITLGLG
jgi:hypothetical protein